MRVLITGVTGQLGRALVETLTPQASIIGADRNDIDLAQLSDIAPALDRINPELIINAAAYTAVERAEDERELAFRINGEAVAVVAHWAADRGVPLIHFSTDYVFDGSAGRRWQEHDQTGPLSVYGASKLAGEDAIRSEDGSHLIIRTQWVYAAQGKNFLRTIARLARHQKELRVVADQIGAPTSAQLLADVVSTLVRLDPTPLAERLDAVGGVLHVAASGETTWHGFATAIAEGLKSRGVTLAVESIIPIATSDYPSKVKRPANSLFGLTRLKEVFGITPPNWNELLASELDLVAREYLK